MTKALYHLNVLEIVHITKNFAEQTSKSKTEYLQPLALDDINLKINEGEFFSLLGPSGCGKTTLLRIIAGLEKPTNGDLLLDGKAMNLIPAQRRPFNMVFQRYALFPHLTVLENLKFGLEIKKVSSSEIKKRVDNMLQLVELTSLAHRYPETLSGGQAQRVALARAIVNRPRVLLLDEPLSALDLKMREQLQRELVLIQKKLGITFIHVTHDQEEAVILSDRIAVMNGGRLEQVSSPQEIYNQPQTQFVHEFVGSSVRLAGKYVSTLSSIHEIKLNDGSTLQTKSGSVTLGAGEDVTLLIRPEKMTISAVGSSSSKNNLKGKVVLTIFRGPLFEIHIEIPHVGTVFVITSEINRHKWKKNDLVELNIPPQAIQCYGSQSAKT